jgi:hypothetical protein
MKFLSVWLLAAYGKMKTCVEGDDLWQDITECIQQKRNGKRA